MPSTSDIDTAPAASDKPLTITLDTDITAEGKLTYGKSLKWPSDREWARAEVGTSRTPSAVYKIELKMKALVNSEEAQKLKWSIELLGVSDYSHDWWCSIARKGMDELQLEPGEPGEEPGEPWDKISVVVSKTIPHGSTTR